jgi:hypothetical protein
MDRNSRIRQLNPLLDSDVPGDTINHCKHVVRMLSDMFGDREIQLSEDEGMGLWLTLRWVGNALEEANQMLDRDKQGATKLREVASG